MKNILKTTVFLYLFYVGTGSLVAQTCLQKLKNAEKRYEQGQIHLVADALDGCLVHGLKKNDKVKAYKLIVLSCLYMDKQKEAEEALYHLLKTDPNFELNGDEPTEFVNLYNSYRTRPVISVGVLGGINTMKIRPLSIFRMDNALTSEGKYNHKPIFGFQMGGYADVLLHKRFQGHAGLNFHIQRFNYQDALAFDFSQLNYTETQKLITMPIGLKYNFLNEKIQPYLMGGIMPIFLLDAQSTITREVQNRGSGNREITGAAEQMKNQRINKNVLLYAGGGLKLKALTGYVVLDVKFSFAPRNIVKPEMRYSNPDLLFKYGYIDDNFGYRNAIFSAGYIFSFYKPKIKTPKTTDLE